MAILITSVGLFTLAFAALSWWLLARRRIGLRNYAGVAVLFVWTAGVAVKVELGHVALGASSAVDLARAVQASAWAKQDAPAQIRSAAPTDQGRVAPVESLVGGLEARLAETPGDANGWVLLAQSYAFLGDRTRAERALQRAVALGADEGAVRDRIELAGRELPPGPVPQPDDR